MVIKGFTRNTRKLKVFTSSPIVFVENMVGGTDGGPKPYLFTMDADFESAGDGTFTIATARGITTNNNDILITAWDVDLLGYLTSGTAGSAIHGSQPGQTVGIGFTSNYTSTRNMHMSGNEMQKVNRIIGSLQAEEEIEKFIHNLSSKENAKRKNIQKQQKKTL